MTNPETVSAAELQVVCEKYCPEYMTMFDVSEALKAEFGWSEEVAEEIGEGLIEYLQNKIQ